MTITAGITYQASIIIAPVLTQARFSDPEWAKPGRTLYDRGSLSLYERVVPLLIDHSWDQVCGQVTGLDVIEWHDGPWYFARTIITAAPSWLNKGTRASFGFGAVHESERVIRESRAEVLTKGYVNEVSILSDTRKPAEPRAQVLSLRRASPEVVTEALRMLGVESPHR